MGRASVWKLKNIRNLPKWPLSEHNSWYDWTTNKGRYCSEGDPNAYGGYYTQEDAKEIVAYAARRGITVIPEIEMPGHSEEVFAVFP